MRKLMITAVMVAAALGGAAACANPTPPGAVPPTTTAPADQTKEVCTMAISESTTAGATIKAKLAEGIQAVASGDTAKLAQIEADLRKAASDWAAKLTELSGKQIKPEVKTVLVEGAATITALNSDTDQTPQAEAEAKLNAIGTKLAAVCASA